MFVFFKEFHFLKKKPSMSYMAFRLTIKESRKYINGVKAKANIIELSQRSLDLECEIQNSVISDTKQGKKKSHVSFPTTKANFLHALNFVK